MSRRLRFSERALEQLELAVDRIAADDPAAALRMHDRILGRLDGLKDFPDTGRMVPERGDPGLQEVIVAPYRIAFRFGEAEIRVIAVAHGRQDMHVVIDEALEDQDDRSARTAGAARATGQCRPDA